MVQAKGLESLWYLLWVLLLSLRDLHQAEDSTMSHKYLAWLLGSTLESWARWQREGEWRIIVWWAQGSEGR